MKDKESKTAENIFPPEPKLFGGFWDLFSSHPACLKKGGKLLTIILVGLPTLCLGYGLFGRGTLFAEIAGYVQSIFTAKSDRFNLPMATLFALSVALGMLVTSAVSARVAYFQGRLKAPGWTKTVLWDKALFLVLACVLLPFLLVFLGENSGNGKSHLDALRIAGVVMAFLPLSLIILIVGNDRQPRKARWFPLLGTIILLAGIGGALLGSADKVNAWMEANQKSWITHSLHWITDTLLRPLEKLDTAEALRTIGAILLGGVALHGIWKIYETWCRDRLYRMLNEDRNDGGDGDADSREERIATVLEELEKVDGVTARPEDTFTVPAEMRSPQRVNPDFDCFFGGREPSEDQYDCMRGFHDLAFVKATVSKPRDLIIEGPLGSGRTTVLDAIALTSLINLGERVLYLLADEGRVDIARTRLKHLLNECGFGAFANIGDVDEVAAVIRGGDTACLPEICVATYPTWIRQVMNAESAPGEAGSRHRDVPLSYGTLLIDDWLDWPTASGVHLPFFLATRKMMFASRNLPSQFILAVPELEKISRQLLVDRLLDQYAKEEEHCLTLRYREDIGESQPRVFECVDPERALHKLIGICVSQRCRMVVFREGIDRVEAERMEERATEETHEAGYVRVCYCLDQMMDLGIEPEFAVLQRGRRKSQELYLAIQGGHETRNSIILSLARQNEYSEKSSMGRIAPVVHPTASSLFECHLRAALRFLPSNIMIAEGRLGQMGRLSGIERTASQGDREVAELEFDRPSDMPGELKDHRRYLEQANDHDDSKVIYPAFVLRTHVQEKSQIDPWQVPSLGPGAVSRNLDDGREKFSLLSGQNRESRTTGQILWEDEKGEPLGELQLAHLQELLWRRTSTFGPDKLETSRDRGSIKVVAGRFANSGFEQIFPHYLPTWKRSVSEDEEPPPIQQGAGSSNLGFLWLNCPARELGTVKCEMRERVSISGEPQPLNLDFSYPVLLSALVLAPADDGHDLLDEAPKLWKADLSVKDANFLPALTFAIQSWLDEEVEGAPFFGKALAFRLNNTKLGKAVVYIVEPSTTGNTLSFLFSKLLKDEKDSPRFFSSLNRRLEDGWDKCGQERLARFWLPREHRRKVTPFERHLVWSIIGDSDRIPKKGDTVEVTITHPTKAEEVRKSFHLGHLWTFTFPDEKEHILHLATYTDGKMTRFAEPNTLVEEAWWPDAQPTPPASEPREVVLFCWKLVAKTMRYHRDVDSPEGLADCWQTPEASWKRKEGDCEDHSILLACMLRNQGIDAMLVWGDMEEGAHAWVSCMVDGKELILEATQKTDLEDSFDENEKERGRYTPKWRINIAKGTTERFNEDNWSTVEALEWKVI